MKKVSILFLLTLLIYSCSPQIKPVDDQKLFSTLNEQYAAKDYFKFRSHLENKRKLLTEDHYNYCMALMHNVFNDQKKSNFFADKVIFEPSRLVNDSLLHRLYRVKRMNHINLYEYKYAALVSDIIIDRYASFEDSVDFANLKNELKIWKALSTTAAQKITKSKDVVIPMDKDMVGLMNIDCLFGSDTVNFIFDTGANFSVIKRSLAEKLKLEIIEADFFVTAATGNKVSSDIAIAKELYINDIKVENVVFLLFEDEDFSFPQINYYPNGAIGFPIIEALDELHFNNNGSILIPSVARDYKLNNLALEGLLPMIAVKYRNDTLNFNFDTGASATSFYNGFYKMYRNEIDSLYQPDIFAHGSANGIVKFKGFSIDSITLNIADSEAMIYDVKLHLDQVGTKKEAIHGNFGQDYIKQFESMIISFKNSSILFK